MDNNLYEDMPPLPPLIAYGLAIGIWTGIYIGIGIGIGMSIGLGIVMSIGMGIVMSIGMGTWICTGIVICIAICLLYEYEERVLANTTEQESEE